MQCGEIEEPTQSERLAAYDNRLVALKELGHLLLQVLPRLAAQTGTVHRLGELHEVRVHHFGARVPLLVEEVLPLSHPALEVVVQEENLDLDVELDL